MGLASRVASQFDVDDFGFNADRLDNAPLETETDHAFRACT